MKKIISLATVIILCLMLLAPVTVSAASASASLIGPATVRQGDTITINFVLKGSNISGASGTLKYDSNHVQLTGTKQVIASPWVVEFNANQFVAYDNNLSSPINTSVKLFTATFRVVASAGTTIKISCTNATASDGSSDIAMGTAVYSKTVSPAASTNAKLSSMSATGATLSPAFNPDVTSYTAKVPFSVSKLDVKAVAADSKAKVQVSNASLAAGATTNVKVTVTAESGAQKVYTIKVAREQDPNYKAGSNNNLSSLKVDGFLLSPPFDPAVTEYVVWLPYETEDIDIAVKTADAKAKYGVGGNEDLKAGKDNKVLVVCTAEDGSKKEYTIIAKRAAAHGEETVEPVEPDVNEEPTEPTTTTTAAVTTDAEPKAEEELPLWMVIAGGAACLLLGFLIGFIVRRPKKA